MFEPFAITLFPVLFLVVLFGGEELLRRRKIDMGGEPPIDKRIFLTSKYAILVMWGAMVLHGWGISLSFIKVPEILNGISLSLWVSGFTLLFTGRLGLGNSFRIGSPKESTHLKVDGLFRFSRNPMYLGMYATLLASVLYTLNPILFLVGIFTAVIHHRVVLAEEQYLLRAFSKEYENYCTRVRRYL
jgi:protein-S-isoprenylcysteine O-methyltransferase Ste14